MKVQSIKNPFLQRGAIRDPSDFFGRRSELAQITAQLDAMQSISIVGERRIGKSSLLYRLLGNDLKKSNLHSRIIYTDLPKVRDESSFYRRICGEIGVTGDTFDDLERAVRTHKLVACLDEFETIVSQNQLPVDFYGALRSLAQTGNFALVVVTQHSLADLCAGRTIATSPFWNIFFRVDLGLFSREEAEEFVVDRFDDVNVELTDEDIVRVIDLAGCFPFFLQLGCYYLFEMKVGRVHEWEAAFMDSAYDHLLYLWDSLRKPERDTLQFILGVGARKADDNLLMKLSNRGLLTADEKALYGTRIFSEAFEVIVENGPKATGEMSRWRRLVRWCKGGKLSVGTAGASGEIQFERPTDDS